MINMLSMLNMMIRIFATVKVKSVRVEIASGVETRQVIWAVQQERSRPNALMRPAAPAAEARLLGRRVIPFLFTAETTTTRNAQ